MTASRARSWASDACLCGHPRAAHKLGKRPAWPLTGATYGPCGSCPCDRLDVDAEALAELEETIRAERRAGVAAILASPYHRWTAPGRK